MTKFVTLLVEDDAVEREMLADLLKTEGYEVIECSTAEAAELVVAKSGLELQALVTDQNLDGRMSGAELARFACAKFPGVNVIVMSGKEAPRLPATVRFLKKPFAPHSLLDAVRA